MQRIQLVTKNLKENFSAHLDNSINFYLFYIPFKSEPSNNQLLILTTILENLFSIIAQEKSHSCSSSAKLALQQT